jgi:hypothetical protein
MDALWLAVEDEPGPDSDRATLGRNAIALLSDLQQPFDPPSPAWLGHYCSRPEIRLSGRWNVRDTLDQCDPRFLDLREGYILSSG